MNPAMMAYHWIITLGYYSIIIYRPIVREIIKTAIENRQNLIVEGCYIPFDWRSDFDEQYLPSIRFVCLAMTEAFIDTHFNEIIQHSSDIEKRQYDTEITPASLKAEHHHYIDAYTRRGEQVTLIDTDFEETVYSLTRNLNFK